MVSARHLEIAAQLLREPNVPPSDRLPYSPEFDPFCARFFDGLGRDSSRQDVWEAIIWTPARPFARGPGKVSPEGMGSHSWCTQAWIRGVVSASPSFGPGIEPSSNCRRCWRVRFWGVSRECRNVSGRFLAPKGAEFNSQRASAPGDRGRQSPCLQPRRGGGERVTTAPLAEIKRHDHPRPRGFRLWLLI